MRIVNKLLVSNNLKNQSSVLDQGYQCRLIHWNFLLKSSQKIDTERDVEEIYKGKQIE